MYAYDIDAEMKSGTNNSSRRGGWGEAVTLRASSLVPGLPCRLSGRLQMPKMVPTDTAQSMLLEPSSGSNTTTYSPRFSSGMMIGSACSSVTWKTVENHIQAALYSDVFTTSIECVRHAMHGCQHDALVPRTALYMAEYWQDMQH